MLTVLLFWITLATPASAYNTGTPLIEPLQGDTVQNSALAADIEKLNEYIQADKENSVHTEHLYADLQQRFQALMGEWSRQESERLATRKALHTANAGMQALSRQNEKLTAVLQQFNVEQDRLTKAKSSVVEALAMTAQLNLTDILSGSSA